MIRPRILALAAGLLSLFAAPRAFPADAADPPAPDFKEVYELIRQHLTGVSETELNRAAVQGLLSGLGPRVSLAADPSPAPLAEGALVPKANLFGGSIGYLRIARVADGLPKAVRDAYARLSSSNSLAGLVVDLRFAGGLDYAAAAGTADLFLPKERGLLDCGQGMMRSTAKTDAIAVPVAIMVNRETSGAAEALAAVLRQTGSALLLGNRTAGQAMIAQDFPLHDGEHLRIATAPIRLADGASLSTEGLQPDIQVAVPPTAQRSYYADAFRDPAATNGPAGGPGSASTNPVRRPRFNEAELVREHKDGFDPELDGPASTEPDPDRGLVRDPVLARALDVLKGLAVVRRGRS